MRRIFMVEIVCPVGKPLPRGPSRGFEQPVQDLGGQEQNLHHPRTAARKSLTRYPSESVAAAMKNSALRFAQASLAATRPTAPGGCGVILPPKACRADCTGLSD